jgi:sugar lactone lactonase YvrE
MSLPRATAELLVDSRATIGEGPLWDVARQRLIWVDIPVGLIHHLDPLTGAAQRQSVGQPVGSVGLRSSGGLIAALQDGFGVIPDGESPATRVVEVEKATRANRMNDGKCDCRGRFWAGTMAIDHTPRAGTLYRLEYAGGEYRIGAEVGGITVANGLDWSLDNTLMYYIDTPTQRVDVFDFDDERGSLANRRPFIELSRSDGEPDGMTVDAEGCLWVALFRGGKVRRYAPDGKAVMDVDVPVSLVTSCAFGGANLDELYITTARHRLTPAQAVEQPTAGGVFVCRPGATGRPPFVFGASRA